LELKDKTLCAVLLVSSLGFNLTQHELKGGLMNLLFAVFAIDEQLFKVCREERRRKNSK